MTYCSHCGAVVSLAIPPGDTLPRFVCGTCQTIHYQNPKIVVACIPEWKGAILLCKRAIEPRLGYWTTPAGFMENGESLEEAVARETKEEALAEVDLTGLQGLFSIPHISQVYVVFRGRLRRKDFGVGHESLEVQLFEPDKIPWEDLAFPVIRKSLQHFVQDSRSGTHAVHVEIIPPIKK